MECHLQALWLGVSQVHVVATDVIVSPLSFLDLLHRHHTTSSFAPNFFLAKLVSAVDALGDTTQGRWDLSGLTRLVSGGEANDMDTCIAVSAFLTRHGASAQALVPGFGMTETCTVAIYNMNRPAYDMEHKH
jgi:acyl-CoA synthetase (AMP-forming)/AMP-acid ligase II